VGRGKRDRHREHERRNAERYLQRKSREQQLTGAALARLQRAAEGAPAKPRHPDDQQPADRAMHELHRRHVVEEILPPRLEHQDLGRHQMPVHQGERVVGAARAQPRDHAAGERHDEDRAGERERGAGRPDFPARTKEIQRDPQRGRKDRQRNPQVRGQPEVAYARILDEAGLHHVPAERALHRTEKKYAAELPGKPPIEPPPREEPQERNQENRADHPAEEPVHVFPPEDSLEPIDVHCEVHEAELGRLAIFREKRFPIRVRERRDGSDQGLPLDDREAGMRQPRDPADDDHCEHQRGAYEQPRGDVPPLFFL
jgi:hypothetical protein